MERVFFLIIALALLVGKWGSTQKIGFEWLFGFGDPHLVAFPITPWELLARYWD